MTSAGPSDVLPLGDEPTPSHVVVVDIQGLRYPVRSSLDPTYVTRLAQYVDEKMQAASVAVPIGESTRLAVLAALNIADECFRGRDDESRAAASLVDRAGELERLIDDVLAAGE